MLFDTNIFIYLFQGHAGAIALFEEEKPTMATITATELWSGIKDGSREEKTFFLDLLPKCEIIDLSLKIALTAGSLLSDEHQRLMKKPRFTADYLIAATALTHGLPLLTANVDDFKRFPGLHIVPFIFSS